MRLARCSTPRCHPARNRRARIHRRRFDLLEAVIADIILHVATSGSDRIAAWLGEAWGSRARAGIAASGRAQHGPGGFLSCGGPRIHAGCDLKDTWRVAGLLLPGEARDSESARRPGCAHSVTRGGVSTCERFTRSIRVSGPKSAEGRNRGHFEEALAYACGLIAGTRWGQERMNELRATPRREIFSGYAQGRRLGLSTASAGWEQLRSGRWLIRDDPRLAEFIGADHDFFFFFPT